jgi:hypothetical protein
MSPDDAPCWTLAAASNLHHLLREGPRIAGGRDRVADCDNSASRIRLTLGNRQPNLDAVEIANSAYRHGFNDEDIRHAFENALRYVEQTYRGEEQLLLIGPTADGTLLELVAVPADGPTRIIHANLLQAKHYRHLRR